MLPNPVTYQWLKANLCDFAGLQLNAFAICFPTGAALTRANLIKLVHYRGVTEIDIWDLASLLLKNIAGWNAFGNREDAAYNRFQAYRLRIWNDYSSALNDPWAQYRTGTITLAQYLALRQPLQDIYTKGLADSWWRYREEMANALFDCMATRPRFPRRQSISR